MTDVVNGIDVSSAQGKIDWVTVQASNMLGFAICKATEGTGFSDPQFKTNWIGIKTSGLVRGAYHFARTNNDPVAEADHFVNTVKATADLVQGDMLVLDIEVSNLLGAAFINWTLAWLERVEQTSGITPIVYTGGPFFNQHGAVPDANTMARVAHFPLWLAAYVVNPANYIPVEWKNLGWKIWQRSGDQAAAGDTVLHVPGINGNVDHDQFMGTITDLQAFTSSLYLGAPTQTPDPLPAPVTQVAPVETPTAPASTGNAIVDTITNVFKGLFRLK